MIFVRDVSLTDTPIACGTSSDRDTDEAEKFGLTMQRSADREVKIHENIRLAIVAGERETTDARR